MTKADMEKNCQKALKKLLDKKILDAKFKSYDEHCWRLYVNTDQGKMVMTFCRDWTCPMIEYRE